MSHTRDADEARDLMAERETSMMRPTEDERTQTIRLLLDLDHEARHLAEDAAEEIPTCDACGEPQRDGDGNPITRRVTVDPEGFDRLCAALDAIDPNEGHDASTYDRLRARLATPAEKGHFSSPSKGSALLEAKIEAAAKEARAQWGGHGIEPWIAAVRPLVEEIERLRDACFAVEKMAGERWETIQKLTKQADALYGGLCEASATAEQASRPAPLTEAEAPKPWIPMLAKFGRGRIGLDLDPAERREIEALYPDWRPEEINGARWERTARPPVCGKVAFDAFASAREAAPLAGEIG